MADSIDQHLGARVYARRHSLGLTLQQVAVATGTTFQQVHKYETGLSRMTPARLWAMANALGVDVSYFFEGFAEPTRPSAKDSAVRRNGT
jgi:transcriptional regulator with XRE-family HTH domain